MLETSARLLRLLSLLQTRRDWSGADLAERLGVTDRTVRRDVDKLRSLGYPVHAVTGTAGGYRLGAGAALPPLLLDDEEAVAVAVGLRTASNGTVAGIEETSVRALAKLEQVLPARLRNRVNALGSMMVPLRGRGPTVDAGTLAAIAGACRDHERLRFDYRDRDGGESLRQVEPLRLVHTGRRWYLVAYDLDRDAWRTFRVDRLVPRTPTGPRFAPRDPPDEDLAAYTAYGLSNAAYRHQAVITLHLPLDEAAEHIGPTNGVLEARDERSCTLRAGASSLDGLVVWISLIGCEFEVQEPPELAERMTGIAARLTRAAQRSRR
ncbi:helix-turn-helix transcriptional regulator [Actinokineospora iranica]|uniref:Predicted DNA-binding transcriptional regulator YafY, contains an HTH and WYL domains n=1 Tax=Actinokineospora iranica TaxID=1271860 RepID=A0A1G6IRY0_9PSEU|nr:YafY family protein [Actinokineospora iranica]SDC08765.1 Predicted DNA-binding transcriptional regulator YafY, contains an HTH and WYL domains [Actinokineospora iranica]